MCLINRYIMTASGEQRFTREYEPAPRRTEPLGYTEEAVGRTGRVEVGVHAVGVVG